MAVADDLATVNDFPEANTSLEPELDFLTKPKSMKKIVLALVFAVSSCSAVPAMANYDKDLCEWSMTADESEVAQQIRADVGAYQPCIYAVTTLILFHSSE
ncbi:hypothetical protein vBKpnAMK4_00509 [Klebsiella phage vB_Kpn_AM_K4]